MAILKVSIDENGLVIAEKAKERIKFGQVKTSDSCKFKDAAADFEQEV